MANENINNNEVNLVLEAIAKDPKIPWQPTSVVKVPGCYNVYACGTTGDVNMIAWIHENGSVMVKYVCW